MMIRQAVVLGALLLLPAALHAQQGQGGQGRGMGMGGAMMAMNENVPEFVASKAADLALSAEQVTAIETIARKLTEQNEAIVTGMRAAMQGGGQPDRARMMESRDKLMKNRDAAQKELEAVLTADQLTRANTLVEEWRRTRPQQRRPGGGR